MNRLPCITFAALLFCAAPTMAQPYGYLAPSTQTEKEALAPAAEIPQQMQPETTTETLEQFVPERLQGQVHRGVLPQLFSRNFGQPQATPGARPSGRRPNRRQATQQSTGRPRTTRSQSGNSTNASPSEVRAFVDNAFKFDSNKDGNLAAHELSSLFLVITSTLNADETGSSPPSSGAPLTADQDLIRRQSVREAETMFLQRAFSFDTNTDGALSSGEVSQMAACIQQNNFGLIDTAQQQQQNTAQPVQPIPNQPAPAVPFQD